MLEGVLPEEDVSVCFWIYPDHGADGHPLDIRRIDGRPASAQSGSQIVRMQSVSINGLILRMG